jgi:long-chain acyl-CoA synthetase
MRETEPWKFLDAYRGRVFSDKWPTLPQLFDITAERFPDSPCFTVYSPQRVSLTYREARTLIVNVAAHLGSVGIKPGTHVAVTGKNSPEWAIAFIAVLYTGAVVVPIDYQLSTQEIITLIKAGDVMAAFIDEEKFEEIQKEFHDMPCFALTKKAGNYIYDMTPPQGFKFEQPPVKMQSTAAILFTSGTTGVPKGVMLSHENFVSDCFFAQSNLNISHEDVFYALLPIHHSYTMLAVFIESLSVGAELVFGKRMVVKQILSDLKAAKVTMFLGVPMLFNKLLAGIMKGVKEKGAFTYALIRTMMAISGFIKKAFGVNPGRSLFHSVLEKASLSSIRICISGGGPLDPKVFRQYNELGIDFVQGYGLTETSPILTLNPVEHYKETSVGKILPGIEIRIENPDEDGIGEIVVRGSMVMQGYYKMPEETAQVLSEDGWLSTGDLGKLDKENYLYLAGRIKNLIVTEGGKNVYPEEIENEFQLYDEIDQILVRGYNPEGKSVAEEIEALIYPNQDWISQNRLMPHQIEARIQDIITEVNQRLRPYQKISRTHILKEPLEMTTTKKLKRQSAKI